MWSSITTPDRATPHPSPLTGDWRNGDNMEAWLIKAIDGATKEVLVAVQELSLPRIARALIAAQQRGIRVAVVLEHNYRQAWSEQRPSRLKPRERQRWHQLNRLADSDHDGTTTADEAFHVDAVALQQMARNPLIDDTDSFGIDSSATFAAGKNKKTVKKKLAKQDFDFLHDEKKGGLYSNENSSDKGFGDGGIIAILKGAPDLTSGNLEFI